MRARGCHRSLTFKHVSVLFETRIAFVISDYFLPFYKGILMVPYVLLVTLPKLPRLYPLLSLIYINKIR